MRRIVLLLFVSISSIVHAQDPNLQRGFAPGKAYDFLGLDSVSLMNGNLNVRIPLGQQYSVGPVLEYQFMLAYNSKVWEIVYTGPGGDPQLPQSWAVPEIRSNAGFGWQLTLGTLLPPKVVGTAALQGWTYLAPDGSEHEFPTVDDVSVAYSEDGSYLRLRRLQDITGRVGYHEIDFPNEIIRQFDGGHNLTEIRDRYGYKVKVARTATQWTVTEEAPGGGAGRTHTILFENTLNFDGQPYMRDNFKTRPVEVNLAAFGASTNVATYQLAYTDAKVQVGPCADALTDSVWYVPQLNSITFPDQSTFSMAYLSAPVDRCTQATLNVLTLPTGGKIRWSLGSYELANQACIKPRAGVVEDGWRKIHAGVVLRTLEGANGTIVEKRTYTPDLPMRLPMVNQRCGGGTEMWLLEKPPDMFKNTVTVSAPTGPSTERVVEKTMHYFSAYPAVVDGTMTGGALVSPANGIEYGLPIARGTFVGDTEETKRFLSSQVYSCDGTTCSNTVVRTTYLKYALEQSFTVSGDVKAKNPRVEAQRTVFEDDSCGGTCRYYTDSASSNFDGYGHYETSVFTSNIPGTQQRTTFTDYTPDSTNWLLSLYTTSWLKLSPAPSTIGGTTMASKSIADFDSTHGVMKSLRTLGVTGPDPNALDPGPGDLLTAWCRDSVHGFVTSVRYFGGDGGSVPSDPCTASRGTKDYFIDHTYTFNGAIVATHKAKYAGTSHFISDEEIDRNTGWPKLSRDSAGVRTKYTFDTSARILSIRPYDSVETHYEYPPATGSPRKIAARQECPVYDEGTPSNPAQCTSGSLIRSVYYYDDLGRLIQERRQFPSLDAQEVVQSKWAVTTTKYGPLGRTEWASVPIEESLESFSMPGSGIAGTSWTHDHLGRVTLETRPDNTATSFVYRGDRETERYVGGEKRSTDTFNGLGRLVKVTQRPDATGDVVTSYGYDAGGRLTSVRMSAPDGTLQSRMFDYDGRGFLRWESQPESGMASYTYDSRGHLLAKDQSAANSQFDLSYTYDAAERLTVLSARNPNYGQTGEPEFRLMKAFAYGTENLTNDLRKGKLVAAARYNYPTPESADDNTYRIEDVYAYGDASGRKTVRATTIYEVVDSEFELPLREIETRVAYNAVNLPVNMQYPMCFNCGTPGVDLPDRSTMTYAYQHGRLKSIAGFVSDVSYWPSGLRNLLVHTNDRTDKQVVGNMARPSSISFIPTPVTRCQRPTFITQPASTTVPAGGGNATLSVVPGGTGPFEYEWIRVSDGETMGTPESQSITVNVTANEKFYVNVRNACGYEQSQTAEVTLGGCVAPTIHGIEKIRQPDGTYMLKPDISAGSQRQYSWVRLSDSTQISTTETVIVPAPVSDVTYRFTVTDSCSIPTTQDATLTVAPTITKTDLVATAVAGSAQVTITWPASPNVDSYSLQRRSGGEWEGIASSLTGTSYVSYVDDVAADKTYAYRAYAVRSGITSDFSNTDVATTRSFQQAIAGQPVTPAPFDGMLAAVNSVRAAAGWTPVTWSNILASTDPLPQPSNRVVERHLTSARYRMNEALSALGVPLRLYVKKTVLGAPIAAADVNEVQQRAQ